MNQKTEGKGGLSEIMKSFVGLVRTLGFIMNATEKSRLDFRRRDGVIQYISLAAEWGIDCGRRKNWNQEN